MPEFQVDTRYAQAYHIFHQKQRHRATYGKFDEAQVILYAVFKELIVFLGRNQFGCLQFDRVFAELFRLI